MLEFISNNAIISSLIAGLLLTITGWLVKFLKTIQGSNKINAFMYQPGEEGQHIFRSTKSISSATRTREYRALKYAQKRLKKKP